MTIELDGVNNTLKTDKIEPQSGTALQVGASGDTITVPSGATINIAGTISNSGTASGFGGITMVNPWKLTSSIATSSAPYTVATNWSSRESLIGGVMTEASGVVSFPTTNLMFPAEVLSLACFSSIF